MTEETAKEKGLSEGALESRKRMIDGEGEYVLRCQIGGFITLKKGELVILLNGKKREKVRVS